MTFTYTQGIPSATDNPSDDQPNMTINNDSNYAIWQVDHHGFAPDPTGGQHIQQTYPGFANPSAPSASEAASVAYPAAGVDINTVAQYYFQNTAAIFPLSAIRAFGVFTPLEFPGNATIINSWNINAHVVQTDTATTYVWTIALKSGATSNDHAAVFVVAPSQTGSSAPIFQWTLVSNVLTITLFTNATFNQNVSFLVLEI
jgi:hypothetical protein